MKNECFTQKVEDHSFIWNEKKEINKNNFNKKWLKVKNPIELNVKNLNIFINNTNHNWMKNFIKIKKYSEEKLPLLLNHNRNVVDYKIILENISFK